MYYSGIEYEAAHQRQQDLLREARERRLAEALREGSEKRGRWLPSLGWELRRYGGRVLKFSRRVPRVPKVVPGDVVRSEGKEEG